MEFGLERSWRSVPGGTAQPIRYGAGSIVAAAFLEGGAFNDAVDQLAQLAVVLFEAFDELVDGGRVVVFDAAADRVGEEFLRQAAVEILAALGGQDLFQFGDVGEFLAGEELAAAVDLLAEAGVPCVCAGGLATADVAVAVAVAVVAAPVLA